LNSHLLNNTATALIQMQNRLAQSHPTSLACFYHFSVEKLSFYIAF